MVHLAAAMVAAACSAAQLQVQLADGQRTVPSARNLLPTADAVSQTVDWRLKSYAMP